MRWRRKGRGVEPFLIGARSCAALLESLEHEEDRRAALQRHAHFLVRAGTAHLKAGAIGPAIGCFLRAAGSVTMRQLAGARLERSGTRLERSGGRLERSGGRLERSGGQRKRLRSFLRPLLGRESRAWRRLPWPRLRRRCFADPIDCVIHALLASKRHVRFVQIGSNDGMTNDPLWTFRHYHNWSGVLVEPLDSAFRRLSLNYAPWKDRFSVVHAAIAQHTGTAVFHHFIEPEGGRTDHDQFGSLDPDHLRRHAHRFAPVPLDITATEVPSLTFGDLLAAHGLESVDLLHIDVEGSDETILRQGDLVRNPPAVILYEHVHLRSEARTALQSWLARAGYDSLEIGADTLALHGPALAAMPALRSAWRLITIEEARRPAAGGGTLWRVRRGGSG